MESPPKISPFNCPSCGSLLPFTEDSAGSPSACPRCRRTTRVLAFPALTRPATVSAPAAAVLLEQEAACFYHPQKRAQTPCDLCGRFLCGMCDLEFGGQHLCPQCLETGAKKGKIAALEHERKRWDQVVGATVLLPLILCGLLLPLTAMAALILILWKWNAPPSRLVNTRVRLGIYGAMAFLELLGGSIAWWMIATGR